MLLIQIVLALIGLWLITGAALVVFARPLIYPFQPGYPADQPVGLPGARVASVAAGDGTPLTIWVKDAAPGAPVVIYFSGNAGILAGHAPLLAVLAGHGFGIAAMNYRGAGGAPGKPSQEALIADALALYDALDTITGNPVPPQHRIFWGTSLGAAVAIQLAALRPGAAMVLESPFNRLCEVAQIHYPIYPVCRILPWERWDSADVIGGIDLPLLVLHGEEDSIIPVSQGRKLYNSAAGPKRLITYPGAGHNDLPPRAAARDAAEFLGKL